MSEISYITCELKYEEGKDRIHFQGSLEALSYMTVLITNAVRAEYLDAGLSDEHAKKILLGGIEKFWGDPETGGRSKNHEDLSK